MSAILPTPVGNGKRGVGIGEGRRYLIDPDRITTATCEGFNSKIQTIKKTPMASAIGTT